MEVVMESKYKAFENLTYSKWVKYAVYMLLFSYFYNLPVMNYSITGDNELRLFDFAGILLIYIFLKHKEDIRFVILNENTLRYGYYLLLWCNVMWFSTLVFSIGLGKFVKALQSLLYLYHFWTFFLGAVILVLYIQDLKQLKRLVTIAFIIAFVTFLIVILQNFNIIPFLWSDEYLKAYSFLSGTLGPNKIVLGMTCFLVFALGIGVLNDERVKINKIITAFTIAISLITLIMSGSRTTYVALGVFLFVYAIFKTKSFLNSIIVFSVLGLVLASLNIGVFEKAMEVYEHRVINKIKNPKDIEEANVDELYEDLGAGRKGLSIMYVEYLLEKPYIIPFGVGFNNRLMIGSSAHNMYLSVINELGLVGMFLYFRWLLYPIFVDLNFFKNLKVVLIGLTLAMAVTLLFGEHLYVYRPLFGLLGLYFFVTTILLSPHYILNINTNDIK